MKYRNDRSVISFHLILFTMAVIITLALTMRTTQQEREQYHTIMSEALDDQLPGEYEASQNRDGVYREIVLTHKGSRLHTRMTADKGVLTLHRDNDQVVFTERLENFACLMQEELFFEGQRPMQRLRLIESHEAHYDYTNNTLRTQEMTFARFTAPSHDLPKNVAVLTPTLTGKANTAEVTFKESGPVFHAQHLQVNLPHARVP